MKNRTIRNPFHNVKVGYYENRTETEYDRELMRRYLRFLQEMNEHQKKISPLMESIYDENLLATEILSMLEESEKIFSGLLQKTLQYKQSFVRDNEAFKKYKLLCEEALRAYAFDFHKGPADDYRKKIEENEHSFDELYNWFEDGEAVKRFEQVDGYARELTRHKQRYALSADDFVNDLNEMKHDWQNLEAEWGKLFMLRESVVKYDHLVCNKINEVNKLYEQLNTEIVQVELHYMSLFN